MQQKTYTWEEIEAAIRTNSENIVNEIAKAKLIPQYKADHPAQAAVRQHRIAQIREGAEITVKEIRAILESTENESDV